jgi:RND superfamily putative drug exporter
MMLFAILFGLSMDYEVFLLSRVREEYLRRRDNDSAVVEGISATARVITSAALIMISVFAAFVVGDDPIVKMLGLGLATAVFIDATVIRIVLVPATMKLLGDWNWWLPGWLDRILPNLDVEGSAGLPEPEYEPGRGPAAGDGSVEPEDEEAPTPDPHTEPALAVDGPIAGAVRRHARRPHPPPAATLGCNPRFVRTGWSCSPSVARSGQDRRVGSPAASEDKGYPGVCW